MAVIYHSTKLTFFLTDVSMYISCHSSKESNGLNLYTKTIIKLLSLCPQFALQILILGDGLINLHGNWTHTRRLMLQWIQKRNSEEKIDKRYVVKHHLCVLLHLKSIHIKIIYVSHYLYGFISFFLLFPCWFIRHNIMWFTNRSVVLPDFKLAYSFCSVFLCHDSSFPTNLSLVYRQLLTLTLTDIRGHHMQRPTRIIRKGTRASITMSPMNRALCSQPNESSSRATDVLQEANSSKPFWWHQCSWSLFTIVHSKN